MSGGSKIAQAVALGSYFLSGCLAINTTQILGAPLYLMNEDWYNTWIAFTKQSFNLLTITLTQWWAPTVVRVSGDASMRGQLFKSIEGDLICNFPERLIMIANHQIYTDWLYLWWVAYCAGAAGRFYIILKESLKRIPVIGWGIQLSQFILLKRNWEKDKPHLSKHLQKLNNQDPMWLLLFPEGTNLAPSTREGSKKWAAKNNIPDMQHTLHPRTTGLQFCLQELRRTVAYMYDCTVAYEGVPRGQYAQDIYTLQAQYLNGKPPDKVHMYWRRFKISDMPIDNTKSFESWLRARWIEKDAYIEHYYRTGRMPCDRGTTTMTDGTKRKGCGYIEATIKAKSWQEFLQVFAPIGALSMVLYSFYNQLPREFVKSVNSLSKKAISDHLQSISRTNRGVPESLAVTSHSPTVVQNSSKDIKKKEAPRSTIPQSAAGPKSIQQASVAFSPVMTTGKNLIGRNTGTTPATVKLSSGSRAQSISSNMSSKSCDSISTSTTRAIPKLAPKIKSQPMIQTTRSTSTPKSKTSTMLKLASGTKGKGTVARSGQPQTITSKPTAKLDTLPTTALTPTKPIGRAAGSIAKSPIPKLKTSGSRSESCKQSMK